MKKLNNKGFAISTVIYAVLIIAVLIMGMLLSTMVFSKKTTDDLVYSVEKDLNSHIEEQDLKISSKICKRARTLHSETCTSSSTTGYCTAGGTSITYGQLGNTGVLTSGDAFDCDVNGDGNYDPETERFYYVTDLESDSNIAGDGTEYNSNGTNYDGPITASSSLPTTTAWPKVTLYNNPAQIYNFNGGITVEYSGTHTLPKYKYTTAARLLTYQEYLKLPSAIFWEDFGGQNFPSCLWLNTPSSTTPQVYAIYAPYQLNIGVYPPGPTNSCGVKPVIEVKKTDIDY